MLPSHFIRFEHCGEFIAFYLPDADHDFVQRCMYRNKTFWEIRQLRIAKKYFPQNGFFVDVGAYIGNHSVYVAKFFGARKIYAFEPQEAIIPILKKNILINSIDDKIEFFPVALTEHVQMMSISRILPGTSAGTAYGCDPCGETIGMPLDAYEIPCVDMLKIDVEGEEISVLRGAAKTIQRAHPIIWLEICSKNSLAVIQSFLQNYGYEYYKLISEMDYLFFHSIVEGGYPLERGLPRLVALDECPAFEGADSLPGQCRDVGVDGKYESELEKLWNSVIVIHRR